MLIIANSIPVGFCQDDRWTINENNEGILVYTQIWRCDNKHNTTLGFQKTVISTEIEADNQYAHTGLLLSQSQRVCVKNVRSLQRECRHVLRCLRSGGCHERLREIVGNTCHTHSASDISIRLFYWSANDE